MGIHTCNISIISTSYFWRLCKLIIYSYLSAFLACFRDVCIYHSHLRTHSSAFAERDGVTTWNYWAGTGQIEGYGATFPFPPNLPDKAKN